jgi:hypothetical protein
VEYYLQDWVHSSGSWGSALNKARDRKMGGFDRSDPFDANNRTAAEHYIFGRFLASGGMGTAAKNAYLITGGYWALGYQIAKKIGFYPTSSPASSVQLYWGSVANTDAIGITKAFTGDFGICEFNN